jgi:tetratricopeptide (TPR) repeat protein
MQSGNPDGNRALVLLTAADLSYGRDFPQVDQNWSAIEDAPIDLLEKARALLLSLDEPRLAATTLVNIVRTLERSGRFDKALQYSREALEIRKRIHDSRGVSNALSTVGSVLQFMGKVAEARTLFTEALEVARASGSTFEEGRALLNLGAASGALRDSKSAADYSRRALVILRPSQDVEGQILALWNLAIAATEAGELGEPERALHEVIPLMEIVADPRLERARRWRDMLRADRLGHARK